MNERIKILLKQATITRYSGYAWSDEVDQQQFAELIVKECQLRVEQYINECGEVASMPDTVIMKHFGVEL
jgi:uncharacterized protein involved in tolerance to divalent cations